jgi:hypothetical protein
VPMLLDESPRFSSVIWLRFVNFAIRPDYH